MACMLNLQVFLPNGNPASYASVTVYEVRRFLWWEIDAYITSRTADLKGNVSIDLVYGRKYHFVLSHVTRKADAWLTMNRCPTYASASFR